MKSILVILGNQLFPNAYIGAANTKHIYMAEDHELCTHFKHHKHKIIFFLSAMRSYRDELKDKGYNVTYIDATNKSFKNPFEVKLDFFLNNHKSIEELIFFEIEDKFFEERIIEYCDANKLKLTFLKSPMFFVDRDHFKDYLHQHKKPFMKTFYEYQRKRFKILVNKNLTPVGNKWSFDSENRKKLPKTAEPPSLPQSHPTDHTENLKTFVEKEFSDHPGEVSNFWIPTTRKQSLYALNSFVKERLKHFGDFQDAITPDSDFVFHSVLSPMINAGLILPEEVVQKITDAYHESKTQAPLNSVEGFVRQVLGWREFVRGIYQNFSEQQWETNHWKHHRKLNSTWYEGNTGIPVLDDAIKKTIKYSYAHHIERLMILSNFMLLCEIDPHDVHRWFMEMFSDSSDWVMGPNVFGMGQFSDGGIFATKPYICGSNYYRKMGNYKKGDWCDIADGLYWRFIDKHKTFYKNNPRMSMMVKTLDRLDSDRKKNIFKQAEVFIDKVSSKP